ncbi:hypothetical protein HWB92_gp136 [Serratia phage vB_SmaA_3M]|uniref:Uncharacterized protein n=2 Tax=Miltonvirus TaxID=2841278 RepID=A0A249Y2K9_9CAUD|nr:hypothetical protein HWB92_gp136 [Serratia phage vB_SmaA_3M]ASZ78909.1 hypothetical protein 2050H1_143 [Serratia phage 2050H1]AYP28394.1 hypothetical protein 3M_138 [Serratia phage vB_SmaA_3M]
MSGTVNNLLDVAWSTQPMHKIYKMPMQAMIGIINDSDKEARLQLYLGGITKRAGHVSNLRIMQLHEDLQDWAPRGDGMTDEMVSQYMIFTLRATLYLNPFFIKEYPVRATPSGQLLCRPRLEFMACSRTKLFTGLRIINWRDMFKTP